MKPNELPTAKSLELARMHEGQVEVWSPVEDDVVQIGVLDLNEFRPLAISVSNDEATIRRADGTPLQVERLENDDRKTPLFERPVDEMKLRRTEGILGRIYWQLASEDVSVTEYRLFCTFVDKIGIRALQNQRTSDGQG